MNLKKEGEHDFSGICLHDNSPCEIFSVGIFQWKKKKNGKGLKKGKVIYRIRGNNRHSIEKRASELCKMLDNGHMLQKKSETIE